MFSLFPSKYHSFWEAMEPLGGGWGLVAENGHGGLTPLISALGRQRQVVLYEFEASMVSFVGSMVEIPISKKPKQHKQLK